MNNKCFVLLPAYNEGLVIKDLLNDLFKLDPFLYIVIVDDGSTDNTVEEIESFSKENTMNIQIIKHNPNKGLGQAIKTGFDYILAQAQDSDFIITMDADGTHTVEHFPLLIEKLENGYDCVIASRFVSGGEEKGVPFFRKILSSVAGILIKYLFFYSVKDYTSGFRGYRASTIKNLKVKFGERYVSEKGFACMAEILLKLLHMNMKVTEIPLHLRYDLKKGKSKIKILKTIFSYLKMFLRIKIGLYF